MGTIWRDRFWKVKSKISFFKELSAESSNHSKCIIKGGKIKSGLYEFRIQEDRIARRYSSLPTISGCVNKCMGSTTLKFNTLPQQFTDTLWNQGMLLRYVQAIFFSFLFYFVSSRIKSTFFPCNPLKLRNEGTTTEHELVCVMPSRKGNYFLWWSTSLNSHFHPTK